MYLMNEAGNLGKLSGVKVDYLIDGDVGFGVDTADLDGAANGTVGELQR